MCVWGGGDGGAPEEAAGAHVPAGEQGAPEGEERFELQ